MTNKFIGNLELFFIPSEGNNYRPYFLKSKFLLFLVLALFLIRLFLAVFVFYFPQSNFFAAVNKSALLNFANQERQSAGLNTLKEDSRLNDAAYLKAQDMLRNDYFSHTSPSGVSPWYWFSKAGYDYKYAGENLAIDFLDSQELHNAWINSASHRDNIINPNYSSIGIAIVSGEHGGEETTIVVQFFGSPVSINTSTHSAPKNTSSSQPKEVLSSTHASSYLPQKSLFSYYAENQNSFPSFKERAILFEKYGLGKSSSYKGTVGQNSALLEKLISEEKKLSEKPIAKKESLEKEEIKKETPKTENAVSIEDISKEEKALIEEIKKESEAPIFESEKIMGVQTEESGIGFNFMSFISINYDKITQRIFLAVLAIVSVSLLLNIFIKIDCQDKGLILTGFFYAIVILVLFLIDKEAIIQIIPHNLGIM